MADKIAVITLSFIFSFFFISILALTVTGRGPDITKKYAIVSLRDNDSISGNFFLGSGTIDSVENYVMMHEIKADSFIRIYSPCSNTIITEVEDLEYAMYVKTFKTFGFRYIVGPTFATYVSSNGSSGCYKREIIVPKGTVIKEMYRIR
jgi:hypothetical protein